MLPEKQQNELFRGVYSGEISVVNLPDPLFEFTFDRLITSVEKGFKVKEIRLPTELEIMEGFRKNINEFSGAKTVSETLFLQDQVFLPDGTKRPYTAFEDIARGIDENYNRKWLQTEMNTSFASAQGAEQFSMAQEMSNRFPLLQYLTVNDGRVRPEHQAWEGMIKPVDDPFWDTRFPPNDWNCRCRTIRLRKGEVTNDTAHLKKVNAGFKKEGIKPMKSLKNTSKVFNINPAKDKFVFKESQTQYFKDAKTAKVKKGKNNFGFGYK